jgi:hypothetical protein
LGCTEVEVRLLKSEQVPCVGCSVTRSVFGVFTSAPDDLVELAKSQRTFLDAREEDTAEAVLRRCRAWGLQEFYAKDWVPAYRLLCAASHPNDADLIKRAHDSYDETSQCAFPFEYFKATQAQMRAMYGPFYFGGKWKLVSEAYNESPMDWTGVEEWMMAFHDALNKRRSNRGKERASSNCRAGAA